MTTRRIIFAFLAFLTLVLAFWFAYSDSERSVAEAVIRERGYAAFRSEVVALYERVRPSPGPPFLVKDKSASAAYKEITFELIPKREWTETIRKLDPIEVYTSDEGVYIRLRQGPVIEEGFFVAAKPLAYEPDRDVNGMDRISQEIYWFEMTNG